MTIGGPVSESVDELRRIIDERDIRTYFQPVVDLDSGTVMAYEALSRGPAGSAFEMPDTLFRVAREAELTTELDRACVAASLLAGQRAGITEPLSLFVNVEAQALKSLADLLPLNLVIVVEITERDLLVDLGLLLRSVARLRESGLKIAMDDVGINPASLALLPLLRPDFIKLDMSLLQRQPTRHTARVMDAVSTYQEEYNAVIIAEGVETEQHVDQARALGATLGQGWLFAKPSPDFPAEAPPGVHVSVTQPVIGKESTPFSVARQFRSPMVSTRPLLIEASKLLEARALDGDRSTIVLSTFQHTANFSETTRDRYGSLSERNGLVAVFVRDDSPLSVPAGDSRIKVRTFPESDPLESEWSVIVVSATYAAMLTASRQGAADNEDNYEFVFTHNRELVIRGALTLAVRM
ncbi:sensor domain-containing phosphodiesterase [Subtercola boreus]|nr:EAL domain-containing protein [Subtercola boreus]TQL55180.1 EAL domain-containing protein (putative c-di-GMP-specific phosphodiesterase class I) [Subtercola boreus]